MKHLFFIYQIVINSLITCSVDSNTLGCELIQLLWRTFGEIWQTLKYTSVLATVHL